MLTIPTVNAVVLICTGKSNASASATTILTNICTKTVYTTNSMVQSVHVAWVCKNVDTTIYNHAHVTYILKLNSYRGNKIKDAKHKQCIFVCMKIKTFGALKCIDLIDWW